MPAESPDGVARFQVPDGLRVTSGALDTFGMTSITVALFRLQDLARKNPIDYLQVFEDSEGRTLWFIEDEPGVVTALLPEEY